MSVALPSHTHLCQGFMQEFKVGGVLRKPGGGVKKKVRAKRDFFFTPPRGVLNLNSYPQGGVR